MPHRIFHGDGSQIQAGFVRLFQLINDFFCNSLVSNVRAAVPMEFRMHVVFTQKIIIAHERISPVTFVECFLVGMNAQSVISQTFEQLRVSKCFFL